MSVSDWSKLSASGDAAGEVEGVYLERKTFSKFVSKSRLNFVRCRTARVLSI